MYWTEENVSKCSWEQKYEECGHLNAPGYSGGEHKRLGKVMVSFELYYCGSEAFKMKCPSSDSNHFSSKMAEIY